MDPSALLGNPHMLRIDDVVSAKDLGAGGPPGGGMPDDMDF